LQNPVRSGKMQGKKEFLDQEMTRFRLSERVPRHNLYRRLAQVVDWSFRYRETQSLYSHTGKPSLDPVVFFKLVLVGRLENLVSDRRLMEQCASTFSTSWATRSIR
jgi:transposase